MRGGANALSPQGVVHREISYVSATTTLQRCKLFRRSGVEAGVGSHEVDLTTRISSRTMACLERFPAFDDVSISQFAPMRPTRSGRITARTRGRARSKNARNHEKSRCFPRADTVSAVAEKNFAPSRTSPARPCPSPRAGCGRANHATWKHLGETDTVWVIAGEAADVIH